MTVASRGPAQLTATSSALDDGLLVRALLAATALLLLARVAIAAPAADVVVYRAAADDPAARRDEVRRAATEAGAAFVDRTPPPPPPPTAPGLIAEAVTAYGALRFDDAVAALDRAAAEVDATGGDGLTAGGLADLFLFRGLARVQRGDLAAWDDLVASARIDPARVLDPARFPPRAVEQLQRAQRSVTAQPRAPLTVHAPPACAVVIDGTRATGPAGAGAVVLELAPGAHWVRVACPDHAPWGRRVLVSDPGVAVTAAPAPNPPPSDDEPLVQARVVGAAAVVDVIVAGGLARLRLRRAADGRELDRATVALAEAGPGALGAAVARLLAPAAAGPATPRRWYRSRWVWAAGGAAVAAAILIPVALGGDGGGEPDIVVRPTGWPTW